MTDLAIVIVSYNTREDLDDCLRSLHDAPPDVHHEIVVVDNASPDGSAAAVRSGWPRVRVLDAGGNLGYARANNHGIRATSSDFILLLNSDTIVPAGAIDALLGRLRSHPELGAIGPRLVDSDGEAELSFGRMVGPFAELLQKCKRSALANNLPWLASRVRASFETPSVQDWVSGACLLVRRSDAERVGLLDERFLSVSGGCRLLRFAQADGTTNLVQSRYRRRSSSRTLRSDVSDRHTNRVSPEPTGVL